MANSNEAMREALETVRKYVKETTPDKVVLGVIEVWCDEALALPRRQCDVGTPGEQYKRHKKLCDNTACIDCPVHEKFDFKQASCWSCQLVWAQMPYESEVSHGNA